MGVALINVALGVTSGEGFCQIDANGCVTDGAGVYGDGEACTIAVLEDGLLTATEWAVEIPNPSHGCISDYVTIGSTRYCGSLGPNGVAVAAGSTFSWRSDGSVIGAGWTICAQRPMTMISMPELEVYGNPARVAPSVAVRVDSAEATTNVTAFAVQLLG